MNIELTDREVILLQSSLQLAISQAEDEIETWDDGNLSNAVAPILAELKALKQRFHG